MKVPKSLKDITVKQYQTIAPDLKLSQTTDNEDLRLQAWINILSNLTGKTVDEIESLDRLEFKKYRKQLDFLLLPKPSLVTKYLWIGGSLYKATNDAYKLNTAQYVAIKTFMKDNDAIEQLHHLAACSYKRFKFKHQFKRGDKVITKYCSFVYEGDRHVKLSEAFLNKSAHNVLPIVFFCSNVLLNSMENMEAYSEAEKVIAERMKEINQLLLDRSFLNTGDGMQL